jgi:hypothetical protein
VVAVNFPLESLQKVLVVKLHKLSLNLSLKIIDDGSDRSIQFVTFQMELLLRLFADLLNFFFVFLSDLLFGFAHLYYFDYLILAIFDFINIFVSLICY